MLVVPVFHECAARCKFDPVQALPKYRLLIIKEGIIMSNIAKSATDLIGNTPLLEISRFGKHVDTDATILAKLEYFNPGWQRQRPYRQSHDRRG